MFIKINSAAGGITELFIEFLRLALCRQHYFCTAEPLDFRFNCQHEFLPEMKTAVFFQYGQPSYNVRT